MRLNFIKFLLVLFIASIFALEAGGEVLYIDPGHGGHDGGASGCDLLEKNLTLNVSLKLRPLLQKAGHTVHMSRTDDRFVSLSARAADANNKGVKAFASIHINSADPGATGTETYCYIGNRNQPSGKQALKIQKEMLSAWGLYDRGVKEANFAVVRETNMPATLSELGFIKTCNKDAALMKDEKKLQQAARAHCRALVDMWGGNAAGCDGGGGVNPQPQPAEGVIMGAVFDSPTKDTNAPKLSGVEVKLNTGATTTYNGSGFFKFNVKPGKYTVTATKAGFKTTTRSDCEEVKGGGTVWCSIFMPKEDNPDPQPEPDPEPDPQPEPQPEPGPQPDPQPEPQPEPEPQPDPQPEPQPDPEPQPGPEVIDKDKVGVLFGVVRDSRSQKMMNANVMLKGGEGSSKVADYNGKQAWREEGLLPGAYRLEVSADGYVSDKKDCTVEAKKEVDCSVSLVLRGSNTKEVETFVELPQSGCSVNMSGRKFSSSILLMLGLGVLVFSLRRRKAMIRKFFTILVVGGLCFSSVDGYALPSKGDAPFAVEESDFWKLEQGEKLSLGEVRVLSGSDYESPIISPDGSKVFIRKVNGGGSYLIDVASGHQVEMMLERGRQGRFIDWADSSRMRFEYFDAGSDVSKLGYEFNIKAASSSKRGIHSALGDRLERKSVPLIYVYQEYDQIFLHTPNGGEKLISDPSLDDRYFSPLMSSDYRYVCYGSLHTGIYLYDVEADKVVLRFEKGYEPKFSGDGKKLLVNLIEDDGHEYTKGEIYIVDLEKRSISEISNPNGEIRMYGSLDYHGKQVSYGIVGAGVRVVSLD